MSEIQLTEAAKKDLNFECSECETTEMPEVVSRDESPNMFTDYRITVACANCGNETQTDVWECDITEGGQ